MGNATREKWLKLVRDWKASGLTSEEYAVHRGINRNSLTTWSSRINCESRGVPVIEVVLAAARERLEIIMPTGMRVMVPVEFDGAALKKLIAVLGGD